jgi:hypothetical protein
MRSRVFTSDDRAAFMRAASLMGGNNPDTLARRLGENLWGESDGSSRAVDESFLLDAGRRELRWFSGASAAALRSLQTALFHPGVQAIDPVRRAGLHRLARALADQDQAQVLDHLAGLPPAWKECVIVAHQQWSGRQAARAAAGQLRSEMQILDWRAEP